MKKTVYPLVMAALAAFPVLFSCTEKEQDVPVDNIRYEYRFSLAEDATRALLNDEGVFWEAGDNVGLFTGAAQSLEAEVDASSSPKTIVVQTAEPLAEGTTVYAYYPYVEGNTDATASTVVFPAEQSGGALSAMPLAGIPTAVHIDSEPSTIGVIRFLNLGSIIDFRVYSSTYAGETVESITLQSNTGNLAGTAAIDLTGVSWNETDETATIPALTWANGAGSSTVTLTQSAPVATDKNAAIAGGHLYMVVAPGTYSGTITVTTNAARYTFPFTNKELVLNGLKRFNMNLDNATEREDRFVTINLEEATELVAGEKYVLVSNGFALVRDGGNASVAAFNANDLTVSVLDDLQENFEWTLQSSLNNNLFKNGDYYFGIIMHATGTYTYRVGLSTTTTNVDGVSVDRMPLHTIDIANDYIYYSGSSSAYFIYYNTSSNQWDNAKITKANSYTHDNKTTLYKVKDMRAEQNPQFSTATAEYDLYTNAWTVAVPTLSGAQGAVTYTSSDETVAQVDNTGAVTIMTTAKSGDTATITAKAAGNDAYKPSGEVSYTISIVNNNPNVSRYNKVTSVDDLEVGAKYLIVYEGTTTTDNTPKVFNPVLNSDGTQFAKATSSAVNVTLSSGVIESSDVADYEFTLEAGYYLKADKAAKYLYPGTSGDSSVLLAEAPASHALAIAFNNGIAQISNGTGNNVRYVVWSTSNHYFSCNQQVSGQYSTGICLYKLDDGRQAQEISFSAADAEYDLGTSTWTKAVPTLTGTPQGDVTYSSSDETVATVANDGTVTPLKKGTATITAKAAGNTTYKPGQASYTVTIVDTTPVIPGEGKVYRKVTSQNELVADGTYLIVYENGDNSKVFKPIRNGSSFTTSEANAEAVTISNNTITSSDLDNHTVVFKNADGNTKFAMWVPAEECYMILRRNNASFIADDTDKGYRATFTVSNGNVTIVRENYYLRYSTSNGYFQVSNSTSSNMALYKLDAGGTTPDPGTDPDPDPTTPTYTQVSFATGITTGQYLVVNPADAYVFTTSAGTTNAESVTTTGGVISGDYSSYELTITKDGNNYAIQNGAGQYLYYNYSQGDQRVGYQTNVNNWTLSAGSDASDTNAFRFTSSNQNIYWKDTYFRIGGSGTNGVHLYKKN